MRILLFYIFFILNFYSSAQTIAGGACYSLMICNDNTVQAWGLNTHYELGNGTNTDSNVPVPLSSLTGIIAITGGWRHSLALKNDGTVWAWGSNYVGELGDGTVNTTGCFCKTTAIQVSSLTGITAIAAGDEISLALRNDGTVWTWGNGSTIPLQVSSLTGITAIALGMDHALALKKDGTVWAWGENYCGQLGDGTIDSTGCFKTTPVQVSSLTGIIAIAGGLTHSLALKKDGTVWAWGGNGNGQLGNGIFNSNVPVQVNSLSGITAIAGGCYHSLALKNDGTVWDWGYGSLGTLGNGTNTDSNVPVQVSSLTGITTIASKAYHSLARKNDGTVWAWGWNQSGQLGNGTNTNSNVPVQVTGLCQFATTVNEITEPISISVFPNPSSGIFTVNLKNKTVETKISVHDVLGNYLLNKVYGNDASRIIDLSSQPKGIYFIELISGEAREMKKIIVE